MSVTQPLREEHRELRPRIESLRAAAEAPRAGGRALGKCWMRRWRFLRLS
jgi:hypothetical protein